MNTKLKCIIRILLIIMVTGVVIYQERIMIPRFVIQ